MDGAGVVCVDSSLNSSEPYSWDPALAFVIRHLLHSHHQYSHVINISPSDHHSFPYSPTRGGPTNFSFPTPFRAYIHTPHFSYSSITASSQLFLPSQVHSKILSSLQAKYMVDLELQIPSAFDPFADAKELGGAGTKEYVHIRIQQRNGKKCVTTVQGLPKDFSYDKILKALKKEFCCNGNVVQDKELGKVIQLQGDQRKNVQSFLVNGNLVSKDQIKIHGF